MYRPCTMFKDESNTGRRKSKSWFVGSDNIQLSLPTTAVEEIVN